VKPRIRRRYGIWYCGRISPDWIGLIVWPPYGHGSTPQKAYADWREQVKEAALTKLLQRSGG
jgi:hypothetical protein